MEPLKDFLNQGWLGSLIGLISLVLAIFLYWRSRIGAVLAYQRGGVRLLGPNHAALPQEVTVLYKGQPVPRLTSSRVTIWNAGTAIIRGEDAVSSDPPRFEIPLDGQVLDVQVRRMTRDVIAFSAILDHPNRVFWKFDYLDPSDGAVLEILHTSEEKNVSVVGTIKGLPRGFRDRGQFTPRQRLSSPEHFIPPILFGVSVFLLVMSLLLPMLPKSVQTIYTYPFSPNDNRIRWIMILLDFLLIGLTGSLLWFLRRRFPKLLDEG